MWEKKKLLSLLPKEIRVEIASGRAAIVGGAVRSVFEGCLPKDVDVFLFDKALHESLARALGAEPKEGTDGFVHVLSGKVPIELVYLPGWDSPLACQERADFNVAAGVYSAGRFFLPDGYKRSVKRREMRFLGRSEELQASYDRYLRYNREYGYRIDELIHDLLKLWRERV